MVQKEVSFKDISYLELWQPFCSAEQNHLCNFGRGYQEKPILYNHFEFAPVVQEEMSFKRFLIWSSGSPPVPWSRTICAILKEGVMGNIHVKLYEVWTSGLGRDVVKRYFLSGALAAPLFSGAEPFVQLSRGYYEEQFCEIILNLDKWFRRRCLLKIFLIWGSGGPFVQRSRTICASLVEGIKRNNSVKLFWIWTSGSGDIILKNPFWSSGSPIVWWSGTICAI